jgi:uncharacterized membrane protein YeaQ/YmgE (transglycosylase-associated protein family)
MGYISWIIFGALAGWIASKLMNKDSEMGAFANIIVGIVGAFIGGFIFNLIGASGVTGFNIWSVIVAVIGACILLYIVNKIKR